MKQLYILIHSGELW